MNGLVEAESPVFANTGLLSGTTGKFESMQSITLGQESLFLLREISEKLCAGKTLHQ